LCDEDRWVLGHVKFAPDLVWSNSGGLRAGIGSSRSYRDRVVTHHMLRRLDVVLEWELYEEEIKERMIPVPR
jgi:hypothetical protein